MPIALVTGATAGIGAEYARQLAAAGMDVVLVARDAERLASVARQLAATYRVRTEVIVADLLDESQFTSVEARVAATDVPVDYLVNNAGFGLPRDFADTAVADELRQFDLLARVPLRLIHAALGQMLPRRSGTIVTVSSSAGLAGLGSYSAAKAWSIMFARWANPYFRSSGVTVSAISPGFVHTEFHERMNVSRESMAPRWMWLDVETLVRKAIRDVRRRRAVSVPTLRYKIIMAFVRVAGPGVAWAVARRGTQNRARAEHPHGPIGSSRPPQS